MATTNLTNRKNRLLSSSRMSVSVANALPNQLAWDQYSAGGSSPDFTYSFLIPDDQSIGVYETPIGLPPDPNVDLLVLNVDYTVSGAGTITGGVVTLTVTPAAGNTITLVRAVPYSIETQFAETQNFDGQNLDDVFERIELQIQQLNTVIQTNCLKYAINQLVTPGTPPPQTVLPAITPIDNQIWKSQNGEIIATVLDCEGDGCSTLRTDLAQNSSFISAGANLVGYYDETTNTPTTVNAIIGQVFNALVPIGTIITWNGYGPNLTPEMQDRYLFADGGAISRTLYPDYFNFCTADMTGNFTASSAVVTGINPFYSDPKIFFVGQQLTVEFSPAVVTIVTIIATDGNGTFTMNTNSPNNFTGLAFKAYMNGAGDGTTTFNLPAAKGRFLMGAGQGAGLTSRSYGTPLGAETVTLEMDNLPSVSPTVVDPGHVHPFTGLGPDTPAYGTGATVGLQTNNTASAATGITIAPLGTDVPVNIIPPALVVSMIVRVK
jgi:microcystin-dependent protein